MRRLQLACALGAPLWLLACPSSGGSNTQEGNTQPSPNASILPAPLASNTEPVKRFADAGRGGIPADSAGRLIIPDAGPPEPTPWREDEALPRDTLTQKDGIGVTLDGVFKWFDLPAAPSAPEVSADGIKKAREKTALKFSVDLAPAGRMRFVFASASYPLPKSSELRAASDHYGHVLVWPDGDGYRVLRPGMVRAMLAERRADALPLTRASPRAAGTGKLLGLETTKLEVKTSFGDLVLEQASVPNIGRSGELLCRLLLDLVAVDPASPICVDGLTPLKAELRWTSGGKLGFEVSTLTRRQELPFGLLFVPPAAATFKPGELPPQATGVLLTREELAAFRAKPLPGDPPGKDAPGEGLLAVNRTDSLRYVLVDGVPAAWVPPQAEVYLIGPPPGRYSIAWRDFLGVAVDTPRTIPLPARVVAGEAPDAGLAPKP